MTEKNQKRLKCASNLTYDETRIKLMEHFSEDEIATIIFEADLNTFWTDDMIVVIRISRKGGGRYAVIVPNLYTDDEL